jgi:prepilin peptidase CpaA
VNAVLAYTPLIVLVALAACIDWRTRRIPNWLNVMTCVIGLGLSFQGTIHATPTMALTGLAVGFGLLLPAFALGAMGGGDVKLLAAIGAWTGPLGVLLILVVSTLVGMVIAIAQAAQSGKLSMLLRNSAVLTVNLVNARGVGADHIEQTGRGFRSIDRPLPYAVPMLAGVIVWVALR